MQTELEIAEALASQYVFGSHLSHQLAINIALDMFAIIKRHTTFKIEMDEPELIKLYGIMIRAVKVDCTFIG